MHRNKTSVNCARKALCCDWQSGARRQWQQSARNHTTSTLPTQGPSFVCMLVRTRSNAIPRVSRPRWTCRMRFIAPRNSYKQFYFVNSSEVRRTELLAHITVINFLRIPMRYVTIAGKLVILILKFLFAHMFSSWNSQTLSFLRVLHIPSIIFIAQYHIGT